MFPVAQRRLKSFKGDALNPQAEDSGRGMSLGCFADLPAHQGRADRGFQRDLAGLEVHLMRAYYLKLHPGIGREVREFDSTQKADPVFRERCRINHALIFNDLLQEADTADGLRLSAPCFAVSGILTPVPLRAGLSDHLAHLRIDHVDKVVQLSHELVVSLF